MSAQDDILARLRQARESRFAAPAATEPRPERHLVPARAQGAPRELVARFAAMAERAAATVARVGDGAAAVAAVGAVLKAANLPARLRMADDPWLAALPWDRLALVEIRRGPAVESDAVSVTAALAGVAETGTLVMASGPAHPATLNFVPETHIVVLPADRIVGGYEEAFQRAQDRAGGLPATLNLVTGPSRSADIEQTILLGAHGPRRLAIVLVGDAA